MNEVSNEFKSLRMPGMAQCWTSLLETRKIDGLSFYEGLQMLLQAEKNQRKENRNARLISAARFRYQVTIEELNFDVARGLERGKIMQMATGEYIKQGAPILITGATGMGKSWLGTALGYHACLMGYKVAYFNIQKLFETITLHRVETTLSKFFDKMAHMDLLIIDDFGVKVMDGQQLLDFMELLEDRHGRKARIIMSQLAVADWYDVMLANTTAADAILDRMVHTAYRFELKGYTMRKPQN
ncbi:IS21-like element helper ATPase IstB [Alkalitalea saponilacus]|uniref:DNA replication protein DnaC n=1 Tax=Alkalitalea saponilacus TaxID=889453 RepID=A0A1T5HSF6_9BACT|nr:IS21-like element helper ATPase IstB [Alkalitalea saponilacus]ASB50026.1 ATP-binding protein [Alkalitalea saponilacus]SKC23461.1 DNA replication protein DnaC [Alkalitalea saponilacus]